ncbi:hypothetical protein SGLAM104S_01411 [Streptomyces glaucescens]
MNVINSAGRAAHLSYGLSTTHVHLLPPRHSWRCDGATSLGHRAEAPRR